MTIRKRSRPGRSGVRGTAPRCEERPRAIRGERTGPGAGERSPGGGSQQRQAEPCAPASALWSARNAAGAWGAGAAHLLVGDAVVAGVPDAILVKVFLPRVGQEGAVVLREEEADVMKTSPSPLPSGPSREGAAGGARGSPTAETSPPGWAPRVPGGCLRPDVSTAREGRKEACVWSPGSP